MGSKLTQDKSHAHRACSHLKDAANSSWTARTTPKSCVATVSTGLGMRYYRRHIFLDNTAKEQAILLQLKKAESLARKNGVAVAIGHPLSGHIGRPRRLGHETRPGNHRL